MVACSPNWKRSRPMWRGFLGLSAAAAIAPQIACATEAQVGADPAVVKPLIAIYPVIADPMRIVVLPQQKSVPPATSSETKQTPAEPQLAQQRAAFVSLRSQLLGQSQFTAPGCSIAGLSPSGARQNSACPFSDFSTGFGVTTRLEAVESRVFLSRRTRSPWTPSSLLTRAPSGWTDESSAALLGFSFDLLNGTVKIGSDVALAQTWQAPLAVSDFGPLKRASRHSDARWHRIEGKLIDRPGLSWVMTAEHAKVGEDFPLEQGFLLQRSSVMPGSRLNLSSVVKWNGRRISLSSDAFDSSYGQSRSRRLGFSTNGWTLNVSAKEFELRQSSNLGFPDMRNDSVSLLVSLDVSSASSGLLAKAGQSPLFPRSLSLLFRQGQDQYARPAGLERYDRRSFNIDATWETPLGDTTVGYSQDHRIGLAEGSGDRTVATYQLEHTIRRGGWRLGGDVASTTSRDASRRGSQDSSVMLGGTLAYQRQDGPEFQFRIGHDRNRLSLNDRSYLSSDQGLQISAALDLSRYLQKRFDRKDLRLRFEYRRSLLDSLELFPDLDPYSLEPIERRRDRNVVQLSFGMRL